MIVNETEYMTLLLAPFGPASGDTQGGEVRLAGLEDLDAAVAALAGVFRISLPTADCPEGAVTVPVARLADFKPGEIMRHCPWLARIDQAARRIDESARAGRPGAAIAEDLRAAYPDLPLAFPVAGTKAKAAAPSPGVSAIDAVLNMVAMGEAPTTAAPGSDAAAWSASLDALAGRVMAAIFADPVFRAAEAAWRGVRLVLQNAGPDSALRLGLAGADAATLPEVLARLAQRHGSVPPNLILADVSLDAAPARLAVWTALAETADALLAPVAVALSPAFFHLGGFSGLSRIGYPARALDDAAYAKWRTLAATTGGAWLAALFNRLVLRPAYGPENPARGAAFAEPEPLWGSPVWALGAAVAAGLAKNGWPHRLGVGDAVVLGGLDVTVVQGRAMPVETLLSDEQSLDFAAAGLTPLAGRAGGDQAFFRRVAAIDGSSWGDRLFFNRILVFFFRCRAQEACRKVLADAGPHALAAWLTERFSLFFQAAGQLPPRDLSILPVESGDGLRLAIGLTPPPEMGLSARRLEFDFAW